ncbi:DUF1592 domain-containing protein [Lignipirellula cremea]|uniref:Planctomycete cytochrome C n=1 Tax=Lignipirellula cremea TaxID=2528010 RepID=A0A518DV47_9BACT|nr:DUF1592 domain-containing protein [Lignipirellula cremea]QDU95694.1 hypothetical protein Pla8534_35110 [Lignipirellula cremea]
MICSFDKRPRILLVVGVLLLLSGRPLRGDDFARVAAPAAVSQFFTRYCVDCHSGTKPSAALSIDTSALSLDGLPSLQQWTRVHDKLADEKMPPEDAEQPTPAERDAVLRWLDGELAAASAHFQQSEGRVLIRRMNRTEYENTLHDLLSITAPVQELLPEDNFVAGFDTISTGLGISSTHLVRYQEAAEVALQAALPGRPIKPLKDRMTGREFLDRRPKPNREGTLPYIKFDEDSLVAPCELTKHMSAHTSAAPLSGRYRFRAQVRTYKADKVVSVLCGRISSDRFAHARLEHILYVKDIPPNQPQILEFEADLPEREQVYLSTWNWDALPSMQNYKMELDGRPPESLDGPAFIVDWIELEGPLHHNVGYQRLLGDLQQIPFRFVEDHQAGKPITVDWTKWHPNEFSKPAHALTPLTDDPRGDSERLMRAFLPRAFRRPVPPALADYYVQLVHAELDKGERFKDALRTGYKAVLCSPYFLFLVEKPGPLDDYALASRLSYFLWKSMPDETLLAAAARGELHRPEVLRAQTERMLNDPRGQRFARDFVGQWLDMRLVHAMKPDPIYAEYDDQLAWSMPIETEQFFAEVLARDLPVTSFLDSDWTMLNARLAQHYGIDGVEGLDFRKVKLPADSHRGGVITHASVLKVTTNATYTSPVKRGAWVLERILGTPPSPPPPDVEAIEPDIRGAVTIREQLEQHKSVAVCASCHVHIDPPGFALENFDVVGGWRDFYRVKKSSPVTKYVELANYPGRKVWQAREVEASSTTASGETFQNIDEYKQLALADRDQLARNLAEKLLVYGTGATLQYADRAAVEEIVAAAREKNYGFRSLLHAVIQSGPFQIK